MAGLAVPEPVAAEIADGRSDGGGIWGAPHTADQAKAMIGEGPEPEQISRAMMSAFMAFARTDNPNNSVIPSGSVSGQFWVHPHPENIG